MTLTQVLSPYWMTVSVNSTSKKGGQTVRVHLYLNSISLDEYRAGRDTTAHSQFFPQTYYIHVDVHEDEVKVLPSGFTLIRGKGS